MKNDAFFVQILCTKKPTLAEVRVKSLIFKLLSLDSNQGPSD